MRIIIYNKICWWYAKIKSKIFNSHEILVQYYRKRGVKIGHNCLICSNPVTKEAFLLEIGNNVTVATNVTFLTHDFSAHLLYPDKTDCFGRIVIGDNCFIGANSVVLYGVTLAKNIIVAAGSVVTKSFDEPNIIIGGNPAKVIGTWEHYKSKIKCNVIRRDELLERLQTDDSFLIRR